MILGEQNIVQDGVTFIQNLLTLVDFIHNEDQASNSEEFKWNDDGGDGSTDVNIKKNQTKSTTMVPLKMMITEVKVVSLITGIFTQISSVK